MRPYLLQGFQPIQIKTVKETKRVNGLCGDRIQLSTLEKWQGETTCNQPQTQWLHCIIQSLKCNNEKQFLPRRSLRLKCALHLPHVWSPVEWFSTCLCRCSARVKLRPHPAFSQTNFFPWCLPCPLPLFRPRGIICSWFEGIEAIVTTIDVFPGSGYEIEGWGHAKMYNGGEKLQSQIPITLRSPARRIIVSRTLIRARVSVKWEGLSP
jgi:hypothetical protein